MKELYLAVLIGATVYALIDFVGATGKGIFTLKYFVSIFTNVLAGCVLIWALELKPDQFMLHGFDFTKITAMCFGITGQKLFKSIIKIADKNIKTTLGVNKK